jgi:hypothetical protein
MIYLYFINTYLPILWENITSITLFYLLDGIFMIFYIIEFIYELKSVSIFLNVLMKQKKGLNIKILKKIYQR